MPEKETAVKQKLLGYYPELALESLMPGELDLAWYFRKKGPSFDDADWLAAWLVKYLEGDIFLEEHPRAPRVWRKMGK